MAIKNLTANLKKDPHSTTAKSEETSPAAVQTEEPKAKKKTECSCSVLLVLNRRFFDYAIGARNVMIALTSFPVPVATYGMTLRISAP